jgi:hypothetical protein
MTEPDANARPVQETDKGLKIPVPTREEFDEFVRKVAGPPRGRKRPDESDSPPEQSG